MSYKHKKAGLESLKSSFTSLHSTFPCQKTTSQKKKIFWDPHLAIKKGSMVINTENPCSTWRRVTFPSSYALMKLFILFHFTIVDIISYVLSVPIWQSHGIQCCISVNKSVNRWHWRVKSDNLNPKWLHVDSITLDTFFFLEAWYVFGDKEMEPALNSAKVWLWDKVCMEYSHQHDHSIHISAKWVLFCYIILVVGCWILWCTTI